MVRFSAHQRSVAIQVVVFLAGFSFLVYEVSWNRLLALVLGSTVHAATLVLLAFMTGFGVGAWFWGRWANARRRVGPLLGLMLVGVGLVSAVSQVLIARVAPGAPGGAAAALALACLFGPALLMGGVFPLASKIALVPGADPTRILSRIYAWETLGSALGGLVAGYVMLGALGQQNTMIVAGAVNILVGGWLLIARWFDDVEPMVVAAAATPRASRAESRRAGRDQACDPAALRRSALVGAFVCGFAMLALQVIWLRVLRIYLINTSYTFALVSSLVILGLFLGSKLCESRAHQRRDPQAALVKALVLLGVFTGLGLIVLVKFPELVMFPLQDLFAGPVARITLLPLLAGLLVVMPPAVCSGYVFPLACGMASAGRGGVSGDVGLVLMVNTAGAAVGPVLATFVALPHLGAVDTGLLVVAVVALAAALIAGRWWPAAGSVPRNILGGVAALLVILVAVGPAVQILPPSFRRADRDVLFYLESVQGTVSVGRDRGTRAQALHTYVDNAAVIGSTYDAIKVVKMVGHFPFFLGLEARDVLVIGFGIGVTTSAIAAHPDVTSIDCVELVPGLRDAAVFYRDVNRDVAADPRLRLIGGDGRHHLQTTRRTYDLISCDPTHPILGSGSLYTRDYFEHCRSRLNPGGMVSQYLPLHKLGTDEFVGLLRTFQSVFPECTVWLGHYHAVLLGSLEPLAVDFNRWRDRVASLAADPHFLLDAHHLAATLVLDGEAIGDLGAASRVNTDDRSYTEFFNPGCLDEDNLARNLRFLHEHRVAVDRIFDGIDDPAMQARYVRGNELLTESLLHQFAGEDRMSLEALRRACEAAPEDQEFPFLIKLYF